MKNLHIILIFLFVIFTNSGSGKSQRYNANADFLIHEAAGGPNNAPKSDYDAQFPALGKTNTPGTHNSQNSGLRDYIAPMTTRKPSTAYSQITNSGTSSTSDTRHSQSTQARRDYVAPQFTTQKPTTKPPNDASSSHSTASTTNIRTTQSSGKRDYVAPQFTMTKPSQGNAPQPGKVKDLVNFYDNKNVPNEPQRPPSYSSILKDNKNQQAGGVASLVTKFSHPVTQSTPNAPSSKPSFSSDVNGGTSSQKPSHTTSRTTTRGVLPSSIVNNNNKPQGGNSNSPTDAELQILSEELLRKDTNNAAQFITVNYQEKTTSFSKEDKAPLPLLTVQPSVWNIPTIQKFVPLLDNYERDTLVNEYVTPQERNEENAFMDAIMSTSVIRHLMNFLKDRGYVTQDPKQQRDFLKQLWFNLYSRGKGKISSSGFEHVFVSELKNGEVSGLHNWIYFSREEAANRLNYLGYLKYSQLNNKGAVLKLHFNQQGADKPVDSMFIGTSPELEIALYTVCFVTRADNDCNLKLANKDVNIVTHNFRYRSKNMIGSAYPQI